MKKGMTFLFVFLLFLGGCSNQEVGDYSSVENTDQEMSAEESSKMDFAEDTETVSDENTGSSGPAKQLEQADENRKVIYTANIEVETESYSEFNNHIQAETAKLGGYVVESNMYRDMNNDHVGGQVVVRIPQGNFDEFIEVVEAGSSKVIEHYISGQDVTEEFVDLESRLKSKRAVEDRLLELMANAERTEDLLAISDNLANVQEEIETTVGRMNYLQDKTDFSTVTINIYESNVSLSGINDEELNTWGEMKKQFMRSLNYIITTFSALVVFIGGNAPVLALLGILAFMILFVIKRKRKKHDNNVDKRIDNQ